jgi:hypothetical protein
MYPIHESPNHTAANPHCTHLSVVVLFAYVLAVFRTPVQADVTERPVDWAQLAAAITGADRIVVHDKLTADAKLLYTSTNVADIEAFRDVVAIVPRNGGFHCMCDGTPVVRLYKGEKLLVQVTNHHGLSIRTSLWTSDARLSDQERWLHWFDARGMKEPRAEVEQHAKERKAADESRERWVAAMPKSLRVGWEETWENEQGIPFDTLRDKLAKEYPDTGARVLALFAWFGGGLGKWSGFPGYELIPEKLLLEISTGDLMAAAQSPDLSETQLEGAARLFAGWEFFQQRPKDLAKLPPALKQRLLRYTFNCPKLDTWADNDKRQRAQKAFGK